MNVDEAKDRAQRIYDETLDSIRESAYRQIRIAINDCADSTRFYTQNANSHPMSMYLRVVEELREDGYTVEPEKFLCFKTGDYIISGWKNEV